MSPTTEQDYPQIIRQQAQIIRQQQRRIAELEKKVQELSAQVARLSKNSSKLDFCHFPRCKTPELPRSSANGLGLFEHHRLSRVCKNSASS